MSYLLDTQILIWFLEDHAKLSKQARTILFDTMIDKYVSIVSLWEIVIKVNIDKLTLQTESKNLAQTLQVNDLIILDITNNHLNTYLDLPLIHKDPFDRLLIATAIAEKLTMVSSDNNIHKYNILYVV